MSWQEIFKQPVTQTIASTASGTLGVLRDMKRIESDGGEYRLVQAETSVASGQIVQLGSTTAELSAASVVSKPLQVEPIVSSVHQVFGIMNCSSDSCAANGYFWCKVGGLATIANAYKGTDAAISLNLPLALNTDILVANYAATDQWPFGMPVSTVATNGANVISVWLQGGGK